MYKLKPDEGGGINRAVMNRSKNLTERGYDVSILTFGDFNTKKVEEKFRKMDRLDKRVKLLNIYDYYRNKNARTKITKSQMKYYKKSAKLYEKGYQVQIDESKMFARYFNNGIYTKYKRWKKNGDLSHINYFNESRKRIAREEFHASGYVTKKTYYDPANKKPMQTLYYTRDGFCFLHSWYTKNNNLGKHFLFDRNSQEVKLFNSNSEFYTHWLNRLCLKQIRKPYVICDSAGSAPKVMNMEQDIAYRIYVIHTNHFKHPHEVGSPIKPEIKKILDNLKEVDRVVVLTDKQKQDITKEFNDYGNVYVIPHNVQEVSNEKIKKNKTVSIIARLSPIKQISHAIEAFQQVVQEIPDARLEIRGTGRQEEKLRKKIVTLNLSQNVFLKGYAYNTDLVYKRSLFTLLTSKYEGFSLVILESMANGTPVISYDVNYGPSDIITDGEDGYLIKQDKQVLADKMIELLKNPKQARKMGKIAKKNVLKMFNEKRVIDKWVQLFNDLKKERP